MATKKREGESPRGRIVIALISAGAIIIGAIITARYIPNPFSDGSSQTKVAVRVADNNAVPVSGAKVLLFLEGGALNQPSDTNGVATFSVNPPSKANARLFVQTAKYKIYDETIQLSGNQSIDVRLTPQDPNNRSIIVRVVDDSNSVPIEGATVVVLTGGQTYSQSTDSHGLAKFTATFSGDTIDPDISVSTPNYKIDRQRVTLRPDQVQDARLNRSTSKITVTAVTTGQLTPSPATTPSPKTILPGQTVSGSIASPAQSDIYYYQGKTGEVLLIRASHRSVRPTLKFYDPNGKFLKDASPTDGTVELQPEPLPADGTYIIIVNLGSNTGDYDLNLQKLR